MAGGVLALNQLHREFTKLKQTPDLIPNMVSEIIRWKTPLAYMHRVAKQHVTLNGQTIRQGDKVVMWCASCHRDEQAFEQDPDQFIEVLAEPEYVQSNFVRGYSAMTVTLSAKA